MFKIIRQFISSLATFLEVPEFIREHELWKGFAKHKMVVLSMLAVGILLSMRMVGILRNWWSSLEISGFIDAGIEASHLVTQMATGGYEFMFAGAYKYVILIIMELLIFHMTLRTHEILDGRSEALTPGIFMRAQIRMVKVSIFIFAMELMVSLVVKILLGLVGLALLKPMVLFLIQSFFLGFALIDNYNEIHHLGIRDSYRNTLRFVGVAAGIGTITYILILIPLVGPFLGPMMGAVAATLIMHRLDDQMPVAS